MGFGRSWSLEQARGRVLYLELIKKRPVKNKVVMLSAPRADYPTFDPAQMPLEVPKLTWEETGRFIRSFVPPDPVSSFLVDQLVELARVLSPHFADSADG